MFFRVFSMLCIATATLPGQQTGRLIVSAEPKDHGSLPVLQRDDISAEVDKKPARVVGWTPLIANQAPLQLYIVIDDGANTDLSLQFADLKNFINSQPASTQIGVAYLRYGSAQIVQPPTPDHTRAAGALRLPLGEPGIDASPYTSLQDLINKWPPAAGRREILGIMSGIDPYYMNPDMFDPYLAQAIETAQKAGVVISSIYYGSGGHFGHSFFRVTWGQNYLSMLDEDTGGEFYWQGTTNPVALQPFLKEFSDWLNHQYLLTVATGYSGKPELKPVKVTTTRPGISLVTASKIYLSGQTQPSGPSGQ